MKPQEVKDFLRSRGWTEDRFGHMHKEAQTKLPPGNTVRLRIKFGKLVVRSERQLVLSDGRKEWRRRTSAYYGDLRVNDVGKLTGWRS